MSLEHAKELGLPYYIYSCEDTAFTDVCFTVECQDPYVKDTLKRHLFSEHTIIDDRVVRAMKNKADCYKRFYLKNAWTFGLVLDFQRGIYRKTRRVDMFGTRNIEKTYLQEKTLQRLKSTPWNGSYMRNMLEISNVDEKKYNSSVRSLIKAVS